MKKNLYSILSLLVLLSLALASCAPAPTATQPPAVTEEGEILLRMGTGLPAWAVMLKGKVLDEPDGVVTDTL